MGMFEKRPSTEVDLDHLHKIITMPEPPARVQMQPVRRPQMPPIWNVASWLRSLRYEEMMQVAQELHDLKAEEVIDTPEKQAKLLHRWAKQETERPAETVEE